MVTRNNDIREKAKKLGVRLWEIGECLGISDANFSRMLRKELNPNVKAQILSIIEKLKGAM